jgi:hypothetical protein
MLKVMFSLLVLASVGLAQTSSDGSFSVHHSKDPKFSLSPSQMREAENLYQSVCAVVQHDYHESIGKLRPQFKVIIGTERNEVLGNTVHGKAVQSIDEIRMKKWDPVIFAQGVVVLAFDQLLTDDTIRQLTARAVRYSNATVDVARLK